MVDWSTISNLATAGGTLVLAGASFASIRSADRAALSAERAVLASLRPLLIGSQLESPTQKVVWHDAHWTHLDGGAGYVMLVDGNVYLAISLRNVGPGLGVIHGWRWVGEHVFVRAERPDPADFRRQARDLYVAPGDTSFWHAAVRDAEDPDFGPLRKLIENRERVDIDLLYGDSEGGQRTISRFSLIPGVQTEAWVGMVVRHWNLDRPDPR
ncbi:MULTISPECIES: hypothetical protein [Kitasatospora]|uniref:hypothetical protein n=1 Tax=Kitasatospora TaxID=2063 RepID=UPI000C70B15B|nr:hypothetical protein [Kitasatospora sp. GP30]MDH6144839.1 hypothetical protein [Kitasatospora sp. GP30]